MTDRTPEDLSNVYLPDPPIRCASLVPTATQDGRSGVQDGPGGDETDTEPSGDGNGPQTGAQGRRELHARIADAIATAVLPVVERELAHLRRERDMALNAATEARGILARARQQHHETCPVAQKKLAKGFTCSLCDTLNNPAEAEAA